MSANRATYVTLVIFAALAVFFFINARAFPEADTEGAIGSGYFRQLLSILLIIFCAISFFQTLKKEDKKITIPHFKRIAITLGITFLYLLSWNFLGNFYLSTLVYIVVLIIYYKKSLRHLWLYLLIAAAFALFIYALFERLLFIRF